MKRFHRLGTTVLAAALATVALVGIAHANDKENEKAKNAGAVTTLWGIHKEESMVSLLPQGKSEPVMVKINPTTILGGICHECHLFQQFKASEPAVKCDTCICGNPNVQCVAWKPVKPATWEKMLESLPRGVALRVVYNEVDKPESGLKTLTIDRRTVLLPVEGLSGQSSDQLLTLFKPLGAEKARIVSDGKQLLMDMKEDWTLERAAKFEKALTKAGGKIVPNEIKDMDESKKTKK
jgi:hypothetical protein